MTGDDPGDPERVPVDSVADQAELKNILAGKPVRATQSMIGQMARVWHRPSLTGLEILWRWLFGIPFLWVAAREFQQIVARVTPDASGLSRVDYQDPWTAATLLANAAHAYHPAVAAALTKLVPLAVLAWAIVSGPGRAMILARMGRLDADREAAARSVRRIPAVMLLQALWLTTLLFAWWAWYSVLARVAVSHIESTAAEPDVVGYLIWVIFVSLGFYAGWAAISWPLTLAPILVLRENCSTWKALARSFLPGRELAGKLAEVNLVLAIVRIMLIVLAMVFCAAPLPFSDELGQSQLLILYKVVWAGFLIACDYFHVVRLQSYSELRKRYRT